MKTKMLKKQAVTYIMGLCVVFTAGCAGRSAHIKANYASLSAVSTVTPRARVYSPPDKLLLKIKKARLKGKLGKVKKMAFKLDASKRALVYLDIVLNMPDAVLTEEELAALPRTRCKDLLVAVKQGRLPFRDSINSRNGKYLLAGREEVLGDLLSHAEDAVLDGHIKELLRAQHIATEGNLYDDYLPRAYTHEFQPKSLRALGVQLAVVAYIPSELQAIAAGLFE